MCTFYTGFVSAEQNKEDVLTDTNIASVLQMQLAPVQQGTCQEIADIKEAVKRYIDVADYGMGLSIVMTGLERCPHSFYLQTKLATIIGDYADVGMFSTNERDKMLQKSKDIFQKLHEELEGQIPLHMFYFLNEYCWRFGLYKEQYENGLKRVEHFEKLGQMKMFGFYGYYSQGVGAANYAKQLSLQGEQSLAREYAQKAVMAWAQYFSYQNTYYNSYVHYALALGILGEKQEMMRALQRGADLIQKDLDYIEFQEVLNFAECKSQ